MSEPIENVAPTQVHPTPELANPNPLHEFISGSTGAVVLVVLVLICYAMTSQFLYIWDDNVYVYNNLLLRTFGGLSRIWTEPGLTPQYYPMTFTSFWLEVQTVGINPKVSHVINMLLHAGSVLILWQLLRRLAVPGAWVIAAVFAVHPINVESVAWISERKNTLSLCLGLTSCWLFLRYAGVIVDEAPVVAANPEEAVDERFQFKLPPSAGRIYFLFLLTFVAALLSKTTVSVLPIVLAFILWWKNGRVTKREIFSLLPPLVMGAIAGGVTSWVEHNPMLVGASGPEWNVGPVSRLMLVGQTACWYAAKLAFPYPLIFNYPKWTVDPANVLQWLPLVLLIAVVAGLWIARKSLGRGPIACVLIFLACLLPASGLFMVYPMRFSWVADHFAYMASIGLITLVVSALTTLFKRQTHTGAVIAGAGVVVLIGATLAHSMAFYDARSLWEDTNIKTGERSWLAAVSYGDWSRERATENYDRSISVGDEKEAIHQRELGWVAAEKWLQLGLRLNPKSYEAYNALGILHLDQGKLDEAASNFNQADNLAESLGAKSFLQPKFELAELFIRRGRIDDAQSIYTTLEAYEPQLAGRAPKPFAIMHTTMGDLTLRKMKGTVGPTMLAGDLDIMGLAMNEYVRATELAPDFIPAKLKLARILVDTNQLLLALQQVNDVLQLDRNNGTAKMLAVDVAMKTGTYDAAVVQLTNILDGAPGFLPARMKLADVYKTMGRTDDAVAELTSVLKGVPGYPPAVKLLTEIKGPSATQPTTQSATTQAASRIPAATQAATNP